MDGWFTVLTVLLRGDFVGGEGGGDCFGEGEEEEGIARSSLTGSTLTLSISL